MPLSNVSSAGLFFLKIKGCLIFRKILTHVTFFFFNAVELSQKNVWDLTTEVVSIKNVGQTLSTFIFYPTIEIPGYLKVMYGGKI